METEIRAKPPVMMFWRFWREAAPVGRAAAKFGEFFCCGAVDRITMSNYWEQYSQYSFTRTSF